MVGCRFNTSFFEFAYFAHRCIFLSVSWTANFIKHFN